MFYVTRGLYIFLVSLLQGDATVRYTHSCDIWAAGGSATPFNALLSILSFRIPPFGHLFQFIYAFALPLKTFHMSISKQTCTEGTIGNSRYESLPISNQDPVALNFSQPD
jgi:hypothetical protein